MFALMIQNHPHRTGPDLRREFVRRLACHGSTFSRVGASGNPGAVQYLFQSVSTVTTTTPSILTRKAIVGSSDVGANSTARSNAATSVCNAGLGVSVAPTV